MLPSEDPLTAPLADKGRSGAGGGTVDDGKEATDGTAAVPERDRDTGSPRLDGAVDINEETARREASADDGPKL